MKLLIITQTVDKNDLYLGFFHRWIDEFAKRCESVTVICLQEGEHHLPENVCVFSLGKEKDADVRGLRRGYTRIKYLFHFFKIIWSERNNYDAVFVHMNQEYVLLAGDFWRLMGKKVYLWRNHAKGSWLTNMAVILAHKVFYTSPTSYTARFKKAVQMPIGVDTEFFKPDPSRTREPNTVLFLGRISPVKQVLEFIEWVKSKGYKATIAGPILAKDKEYGKKVLQSLTPVIKYIGPVNHEEAKSLYQTHEIYANFTPAGSFDKTVIEARACGMKLEVRNPGLQNFRVEDHSLEALMGSLKRELF